MARYSGGPVVHAALSFSRNAGPLVYAPLQRGDRERASTAALNALRSIRSIRQQLDDNEIAAVRGARAAGASWTEIAQALGVTRQAAWDRWHELDEDDQK